MFNKNESIVRQVYETDKLEQQLEQDEIEKRECRAQFNKEYAEKQMTRIITSFLKDGHTSDYLTESMNQWHEERLSPSRKESNYMKKVRNDHLSIKTDKSYDYVVDKLGNFNRLSSERLLFSSINEETEAEEDQ